MEVEPSGSPDAAPVEAPVEAAVDEATPVAVKEFRYARLKTPRRGLYRV